MTTTPDNSLLKVFALTLGLAIVGGTAFWVVGMPIPWLSGSAVAVAIGAISRLKLGVPPLIRASALIFLGAMMGTAVTPESLAHVSRWPLSLVGLAIIVFAIMVAVAAYLERVHGYDRATARLACIPGALPFVLALAAESKGDPRRIAIIQMMRLLILLVCLPSVLTIAGAGGAPQAVVTVGHSIAPSTLAVELAMLLVTGAVGGIVFERLGAPAGMLFGSMVVSSVLHGAGVLTGNIPDWLMLPGFVIIGAMVGANFAGTDLVLLRQSVLAGVGSVVVGATVALAGALTVASILHLPVAQVWLAYSPGGVETMTIMALALNLDPAYVGAHHVVRFFGLGLLVPLWLRGYLGRKD